LVTSDVRPLAIPGLTCGNTSSCRNATDNTLQTHLEENAAITTDSQMESTSNSCSAPSLGLCKQSHVNSGDIEEIISWSSSSAIQSICLEQYNDVPVKPQMRKLDSKLRKFTKPVKKHTNFCQTCNAFHCKCPHNGKRIKVARVLKQQMNRLKKNGKIDMVYWTVDGKAYESLSDVTEWILQGYRAQVNWRLKGGMKKNNPRFVENDLHVINLKDRSFDNVQIINNRVSVRRANQQYANMMMPPRDNHVLPMVMRNMTCDYRANKPLFKNDPNHKESLESTPFEDQMQYVRVSCIKQTIPVVCMDPLLGTIDFQQPVAEHVNIMAKFQRQSYNYYFPLPTDYNVEFDYAFRVIEEQLVICFPFLGSYKKLVLPNKWTLEPEHFGIFHHHAYTPIGLPYYNTETQIVRNNRVDVPVPCYIIRYAISWFGGKHITNYGITSFINQFQKFWKHSANSQFDFPTDEMVQSAYFHAARLKQMTLVEKIGDNYDVLNAQSEIVHKLNNLPKYVGLYGFLKWLADVILPDSVKKLGQDFIDNWKFTGFSMGLPKMIKEMIENGVYFLVSPFIGGGFMFSMHAFKTLDPTFSVIIEELIKTVPGGGLLVAIKELRDSYLQGKLTGLEVITRFLFHNWHELIPLQFRLLSLPFRIAGHLLWNKFMVKKKGRFDDVRYEYIEERIPQGVVWFQESVSQCDRFHESDTVEIPEIVRERWDILELLDDKEPDHNRPVYITCNALANNTAPAWNGNNYCNAYLKRNIQDRPLKHLTRITQNCYRTVSTHIAKMFEIGEMSIQAWIDLPNHGSKKIMYQRAYEQFKLDNEINHESQLNMKLDETLVKRVGRTINAFDNSHVINVGPLIHTISAAMKKLFNGYNDLALPGSPFSIHVLYCSGYQSFELSRIIAENQMIGTKDKPHYLLLVLGDDGSLVEQHDVLCCDFSRYDSTQHDFQHEMFRLAFENDNNAEAMTFLRKAAQAPTKMRHPKTKEPIKNVPTNGLKTGCPETSVSNTYVTTLSYIAALTYTDRSPKAIEDFLKNDCGFLPKVSMQNLETGFEFLKTLFIKQDDHVVSLPLLSSLMKVGKFLAEPRLIVPFAKLKSEEQIAVDATYMQLHGRGDFSNVPGYSDWYCKLQSMSTVKKPYYRYEYKLWIKNEVAVSKLTMATAYHTRYNVDFDEVMAVFHHLCDLDLKHYPVQYESEIITIACRVDYDLPY
jgi:hypothetical protein